MKVFAAFLVSGLLMALLSGPIRAEEVYVYTNADLEDLPPVSTANEPVVQPQERLGWQFVTDFLEREHARLDAERNRRDSAAAYDRAQETNSRWRGILPYYPHYGRNRHVRPGKGYPRPSRAQQAFRHANRNRGVDAFPNRPPAKRTR